MSEVISVEDVSKRYRLGLIGSGTLREDLAGWWYKARGKEDPYAMIGESNDRTSVGNSDYVWALNDINFNVQQGEVLGIIGKNGAGKSTLLKLLSRVTAPTTGSIKVKGRIASLLEVGTGFHPELTGKENIYLNGAIMGMKRSEITRKLDEIIDFAGVQRYVDTPVKRYSSGMYVRLAFAVAAHLEPEILVIDEVLAVGDAEFQKKAIGKMQDVSKGEGRTVLFVSHNMVSVQSLCTNLLLLEGGRVTYRGDVATGVRKYLDNGNSESSLTNGFYPINSEKNGFEFLDCSLFNTKGEMSSNFVYDDEIVVDIRYSLKAKLSSFTLLFRLTDQDGTVILTSWDKDSDINRFEMLNTPYKAQVKIPSHLLKKGKYAISVAAHTPNIEVHNYQDGIAHFAINELGYTMNANRSGVVLPKLSWTVAKCDKRS